MICVCTRACVHVRVSLCECTCACAYASLCISSTLPVARHYQASTRLVPANRNSKTNMQVYCCCAGVGLLTGLTMYALVPESGAFPIFVVGRQRRQGAAKEPLR